MKSSRLLRPMFENLALALGANAIIFLLHWDSSRRPPVAFEPPGWVVGVVWTLLFAGLGAARGFARADSSEGPILSRYPLALTLLCVAYPFYTLGLDSDKIGLAGDVVTLLATAAVFFRLSPHSRRAAWSVAPVAAWLAFASFLGSEAVFKPALR